MCTAAFRKGFPLGGMALAQKAGVSPFGALLSHLAQKKKPAAPTNIGTVPIDTTLGG